MYIKRDDKGKLANKMYGKYDLKRLLTTERLYLEYIQEVLNMDIIDKNMVYNNIQEIIAINLVLNEKLEKYKYL